MKSFITWLLLTISAGAATSFNGSSQYGVIPEAGTTNYPVTVAAWFYSAVTNATGWGWGIQCSSNINSGFIIGQSSLGVWVGRGGDTSSSSSVSGTSPSLPNTWTHVALVGFNPSNRVLWVNGIPENTNTTARSFAAANRNGVGCRTTSTLANYFNGRISDVATWNVALSDDELRALSGMGNPTMAMAPYKVRPQSVVACPELEFDGNSAYSRNKVGTVLSFTNAPTPIAGPAIQR